MLIQNRLLRVVYSPDHGVLVASDTRGRVHTFDLDLNLLQSSPVVTYDRPINAICVSDKYVFTKDRLGSIGKWDIHTLMPLDFYDGARIADPDGLFPNEVVSPTPNRGIAYFNGAVYTNNGYTQMVVLDAETFAIKDIRTSPSKTFIDCICAEHPDVHALSDVNGELYIGNLETNEFDIRRTIDTNVVHGVVYDRRHDRFWTTQDGGLGDDRCVRTGVTTIEKDGTGFREFKLSHEDNEFIQFDPEHRYLFAGGFNGWVAIFDNAEKDFHLEQVIGPLEFQIIHAAVVSRDQLYVLLQTGDLIRLNGAGEEVTRARYDNRCVWILEPHPEDDSIVYAGTDHGVAVLRYGPGKFGNVELEVVADHQQGFEIVKDVKPLRDGSFIYISRNGYAIKSDADGAVQWHRQVLGVPRGIGLNAAEDRCLVSTDAGTVWELATGTGDVVDTIPVGSPSYGCAYTPDGRRVATASEGPAVLVYPAEGHEVLGAVRGFTTRLKRLFRLANGELFVTGPDGMFELDLDTYTRRRSFGEGFISTKENGVLCDGHVYMGGYGYQVATYRYDDGKLIALDEDLPDFTKALAARVPEDGDPILLVGGRGGFIVAYRLANGVPVRHREFYVR